METKRLYKRGNRLLLVVTACLILALGISAYFILKNDTSPFEEYFLSGDYERLYKIIDNPQFSQDIFKAYMNYNFNSEVQILGKERNGKQISYEVKGIYGNKKITVVNKKGKFLWEFDDYVADWKIDTPKDAILYVGDLSFKSVDGTVKIDKLPLSIYEIRVEKKNCETWASKIMVGQSVEIKLEPSKNVMENGKRMIEEYLKFKENAVNKGEIGEITCINKDSGIYKEIVDEAGWLKAQDFQKTQKLLSFEVQKVYFTEDDSIAFDVNEKWDTSITTDGNLSEKVEEYNESYIFKDDNNNFIIAQIKTNQ